MNNHDASGDLLKTNQVAAAAIMACDGASECLVAKGTYRVQCHDADGSLLWEETVHNLVTTVGKNNMLDNHLSGSSYTAAWYMGLISATSYTTGPAAGDTMASHAGWAEDQNYSQTARPTTVWNSAAAGSKSLPAGMVFTMNANTTIKGCFLVNNSTKGGTTGTLFSAGLFTGGDQPVVAGNTLTVTYTLSV